MTAAPELVERALAASRGAGCVVIVTETSQAVLRWANSTMTTNGHTTSRRWSVVSLVEVEGGTAAGVVSSSSTAAGEDVEEVVAASEAAAAQAGPTRDAAGLPPAEAADESWEEPAAQTSVAVFGELVGQLSAAFTAAGPAGRVLYGFANHDVTTTWLGSSTGVRRRWVQPTGSVELNAKTADRHRSAWGAVSTRDFTDVDLTAMADELAVRLGWGARRVELPAGRYETLLPPSAVADLMVYLTWSMGGRAAQEGRSALSAPGGGTRVGERLTTLPLTLASDPAAEGLEYRPFLATTHSSDEVSVFDNGASLRRVEWLRDGTVTELAYPRAAAAEFSASGATFTPPGDNLLLTGTSTGLREMVAGTGRGLLLTCLWYIRVVDPTTLLLTGLTRDGVYLVEGGEVVGEVNNFRFNESPLDLLRRASEVGATQRTLPREWKDWFTRTAMPPMRVPDFTMSSVSQAS